MNFPQDHASVPGRDRRTPLIGASKDPPHESIRTPIEVHPGVVQRLADLLREPEMRGVGYSEFIDRACALAEEQIEYLRALKKRGEKLGKIGEDKKSEGTCYCGRVKSQCTPYAMWCHPDASKFLY